MGERLTEPRCNAHDNTMAKRSRSRCDHSLTSTRSDLPHKLRTDDTYKGYLIEKDSLVMVNIWYEVPPT